MKNQFLIILLCLFSQVLFAQNDIEILKTNGFVLRQDVDALNKKVTNQQAQLNQLKNSVSNLSTLSKEQSNQIDSLVQLIKTNNSSIVNNTEALNTESETLKSQYSKLNNTISKNQLLWIIGALTLLVLGFLIYYLLGKKINSNKVLTETQLKETRKNIEEESIKLDSKLVEILETQFKLKQEELKAKASSSSAPSEVDHSLALKVADEIIRIRKNLSRMDGKTKGLKQLSASVKRIQNNFMSKGYEIVEMLGQEYKEGMKVTANFVPNENIEVDKEIITRIIKPQVNFNGVMIQSAQIEVSVGE